MPQQLWGGTWATMPAAAQTLGPQSWGSSAPKSPGSLPPYGLYARSDAVIAQSCFGSRGYTAVNLEPSHKPELSYT